MENNFDLDDKKYKKLLDPNRETENTKVKFLKDYGEGNSSYKKDEEKFISTKNFLLFQERGICECIENTTPTQRAFVKFEGINSLETTNQKHMAWLKEYEGLFYSTAENGTPSMDYKTNPVFYEESLYRQDISLTARKKDRLIIEFDEVEGQPDNPKESLKFMKSLLERYGVGFIESTHQSQNSNYLWVEFNRELTTEEAKQFLSWICPTGSRIDLNFCSDEKPFQVLYAKHWKQKIKGVRELPINFNDGRKIDYDALNIKPQKINKTSVTKNGFRYDTYTKEIKPESKKNPYAVFGVAGQVENFYENKPFFYNKSGMFFIWDNDERKYDMCDDVDMLNGIADLGIDTITSKTKQEIINALKQFGRRNVPKEAPITWVQFKDKIIDSKTGEEFESSPDYFMTNTLPYSPSDSEETPVLDDLLEQWVGKEYVQTLYEIMAYSCSSDQFMQRMFALVGGGSNGKGTFMKVLSKFIGKPNVCSSELKELCSNGFETSIIYRQLLCILGEVSHGDMKNSNQIKKLAGEDDIRYCFKGKTAFSDVSITTLISLTNALPKTPDKTMGFYRKWLIVDFPNQFEGVNCNILDKIPEEEFNNLARKSLNILRDLYKTKRFHNEGTFQERMDRYEERSNPLGKFIEDNCKDELGGYYILSDFTTNFNEFAKKNHIQIQTVRQIGKILRDEGLEIGNRVFNLPDGKKTSKKVIQNLVQNNTINTINTVNPKSFPSRVSVDIHGINGINGIITQEELPKTDDVDDFFDKMRSGYQSEGLL